MARGSGLYSKTVEQVLKGGPMTAAVKAAAEQVAAGVRDMNITVGDVDGGKHEIPLPVTVKVVTTDRAHGIVALAHPAGEAVQAKHGALTKAAAQAGLNVTERPS